MLSPLKPTLFCTACCRCNGAAGGASGKLWWITGWQVKELWSRAAYPAPPPEVSPALSRKMKSNTLRAQLPSLCVSPPSLLTKTETNGTSTWFTELWRPESGHTSLCLYLSVTGTEDPAAEAEPTAVVASSPAASWWSPRCGESELSRAGAAGSLGLLQPPPVNHFLSPRADYLVITLFCQRLSDEVRFCQSQGQRGTAERGYEGETAWRLLTDHVPSIKNNEKLLSFCFWRHRRKALVSFLLWFPSQFQTYIAESRQQTQKAIFFPLKVTFTTAVGHKVCT